MSSKRKQAPAGSNGRKQKAPRGLTRVASAMRAFYPGEEDFYNELAEHHASRKRDKKDQLKVRSRYYVSFILVLHTLFCLTNRAFQPPNSKAI